MQCQTFFLKYFLVAISITKIKRIFEFLLWYLYVFCRKACEKRLKHFLVLLFLYLSSYLFKVCRRVSKFDSPEKCLWGNFLHLASPSLLHKGYDFEKRVSKTYANKDLITRRQLETSLRILSVRGVLPTPHYAKKEVELGSRTKKFLKKG